MNEAAGWIWTVYPRRSSDPMVSVGHSGAEDSARRHVEEQLAELPFAAFGVVIGPGGRHWSCRRTNARGFRWAPLFGDD